VGRVNQDDLAPFAVADGLLARIAQQPTGLLTDAERMILLDRARENLALATDLNLPDAGRALHQAADEGEFVLQAGNEFATVAIYGRLLVVMTRAELRGIANPERN
jgi:hypothetical protein